MTHWSKDPEKRKEIALKISLLTKGKKVSKESKLKMSNTWKKKYQQGYISNTKGWKHTQEFKDKISKKFKEKYINGNLNQAWKKGHIPWNKGKSKIHPIIYKAYLKLISSSYWRNYRKEILIRDNNKCLICGNKGENIDHIIPWRISMDNSKYNLRTLCKKCNIKKIKGDRIKYG